VRIADDLELVASSMSIPKLEGVERNSGSEPMVAKVIVKFSGAIDEPNRLELGVFKSSQPIRFATSTNSEPNFGGTSPAPGRRFPTDTTDLILKIISSLARMTRFLADEHCEA
jgi:hypothetical protein